MNVFYLSHNAEECAQYHVDKHVVKMITEQNQILSTTHRLLDGSPVYGVRKGGVSKVVGYKLSDPSADSIIYKTTHVNHPSTMWARQSVENYLWLVEMTDALCKEYTHRYGKIHAGSRVLDALRTPPKNLVSKEFTQPTPAMPDEYKVKGDSIQSYRNYYNGAKARMFSWKNRETPEWIVIS